MVKGGFHSGGPGYAMSNAAFAPMCERLINDFESCPNTGVDDVDVNACLRDLGVIMGKSLDEKGRLRFLAGSLKEFFYGIKINFLLFLEKLIS